MQTKQNHLRFHNSYRFFFAALLFLFLTTPAVANQEEVGKVLMATLGVTAEKPASKPRNLTRRSSIYVGETIKTPEGGRAQIRMADGEMLSLAANSELTIEAFEYQPNTTAAKQTSVKHLVTGGLRTITGAVKGNDYEMKSRAGTIGIRGTAFEVYTQQGENLFVSIQRGNVYVQNAQGSIDIGVDQLRTAARITSINQAPEAISVSDLPQFFEDAFAEDITLTLANNEKEQEEAPPLSLTSPVVPVALMQVGYQPDVGEMELQSGGYSSIDTKTPDVEEPTKVLPSIGPLGFFIGTVYDNNDDINIAVSALVNPVNISTKTEVDFSTYTYTGQQGKVILGTGKNVNSYEFTSYSSQNKLDKKYSTIYIGESYGLGELDIDGVEDGYLNFVFATNVHTSLASLPAEGNYTYNLIEESYNNLFRSGSLSANFATSELDVSLSTTYGVSFPYTYKGSGKISDFYNSSINLKEASGGLTGSITGRFIGNNVEGVITAYEIDLGSTQKEKGVAVFERP